MLMSGVIERLGVFQAESVISAYNTMYEYSYTNINFALDQSMSTWRILERICRVAATI